MDSPSTRADACVGRLQHLALWAVAVVGSVLLYRTFFEYAFEDAYITFRYARNLAEGAGYVFTSGERVFGATAPLYTLLLAACGFLGGDIPTCASVLFASSLGAVGVLGGYILRRLGSPNAAVLFAFLAISGATRVFAYWGIETPFLVALLFAALLAALQRRDTLAGALAGLAFLTRYDAVLFAVLLFGLLLVRRRRVPWKPGLAASLIVAPWLVFAQLYFGSVLPNTLGAKQEATAFSQYLGRSASVQLNLIWQPLIDSGSIIFHTTHLSLGLSALLGVLVAYASLRLLWREPLLALLLVFPFVLWLGYGVIGPPIGFTWYLVPASFILLVLGFAGAGEALRSLSARSAGRGVGFVLASSVLAFGFVWLPGGLRRMEEDITATGSYQGRIIAYEQIGDWILANDLSDLTLVTAEPGYLTYRTRNPAVDAAGLVTQGVYFHDRSRRTSQYELARERRAGLIVSAYPARFPGYVPAYHAYPYRIAYLHEDIHESRYEHFLREFRSSADATRSRTNLRHPIVWDVESHFLPQWRGMGGAASPRGSRPKLLVDGQPFEEDALTVSRFRGGAESPPFRIDFDRLEFRFAGTHPRTTLARLVIGGRVVLEQGGWPLPGNKPRGREFTVVSWPVHHWRGQTARLRLVHVGKGGADWVAVDHIRSVMAGEAVLLDDFDAGPGYSDLWVETFGDAPSELSPMARRHGVEFDYSPRAALSRGLDGPQSLTSRPFPIVRDRLCFSVIDFGRPAATAIALLVDGEVVRLHRGQDSRQLRPVTWDVRAFRGREAVLRVEDQRPGPGSWIGIDDICLVD